MRIDLHYRTLLLFCLFLTTLAQAQLQKIYLHPKAPGSGRQSQFIDSIRFIPLEIKEGVQSGTYNYVQVTDKYFLIANYLDKTILLYAKDGAFVKKISFKKLGDRFFPSYNDYTNHITFFGSNKNYTLTQKDELKIMLDWGNPHNKKYFKKYTIDLADTSFAIKKDTPNENDIIHAYHFYNDYYWQGQIITSSLFKDSLDYEFKIYKNKQLVKGLFPYNRINEPRFLYTNENISLSNTDTPSIYFISRPYCDTIYRMNKDSLLPAYQLVLPLENSLPPSFFTKPFKNKTERENFNRNNGWAMRQVRNFYETPKLLFFTIQYLSNYESYIYQKQTGLTLRTRNIKPDSSQYNVPLLADFNLERKEGRFYKALKAGDIVSFFEQHKGVPVPKELEAFLKSNPPATTPIIIEFKLKN